MVFLRNVSSHFICFGGWIQNDVDEWMTFTYIFKHLASDTGKLCRSFLGVCVIVCVELGSFHHDWTTNVESWKWFPFVVKCFVVFNNRKHSVRRRWKTHAHYHVLCNILQHSLSLSLSLFSSLSIRYGRDMTHTHTLSTYLTHQTTPIHKQSACCNAIVKLIHLQSINTHAICDCVELKPIYMDTPTQQLYFIVSIGSRGPCWLAYRPAIRQSTLYLHTQTHSTHSLAFGTNHGRPTPHRTQRWS